jgi:hypothetical protein
MRRLPVGLPLYPAGWKLTKLAITCGSARYGKFGLSVNLGGRDPWALSASRETGLLVP